LSVDWHYLTEAINAIDQFSEVLEQKVDVLFQERRNREAVDQNSFEVEIQVETASDEAEHCLLPAFPFMVNDRATGERGALLSDILAYSRDGDEGVVLQLCGDRETVRAYLRELKKLEERGILSIAHEEIYKTPKDGVRYKPPTTLDRETIEEIARRLPAQPWPKGIHKGIAADLAISNTQCSRAIEAILRNKSLRSLIGTHESG
jgi:hypothetical protein